MVVVFFVLVVFFIAVAMFMFHELFVKKNAREQARMIISIDQWDEDLIEAFICHIKKFNRYIEVRIIVKGKPESTELQNLLREKYDILWTEG
ncbi:MAG TPA: hypothetical protein DDZ89_19065 [Clostridiales bacterium]|nr:hypothetical protein [Clostridiales bacterium]